MNLSVIQHDINEWQMLSLEKNQLTAWWLGQAGFALRYDDRALLIDPYLSDSPAKKYKGKTLFITPVIVCLTVVLKRIYEI